MAKRKKAEPAAGASSPVDVAASTEAPPPKAPRKKTTSKKASSNKKPAKEAAPSSLTLRLHAPGMTALHRAGLGGLAATLVALERRVKTGLIRPDRVPGGWNGSGDPPWSIDEGSVTLVWG